MEIKISKRELIHPKEYYYFLVRMDIIRRSKNSKAKFKEARKSIRRCKKLNMTEMQELIEIATIKKA